MKSLVRTAEATLTDDRPVERGVAASAGAMTLHMTLVASAAATGFDETRARFSGQCRITGLASTATRADAVRPLAGYANIAR